MARSAAPAHAQLLIDKGVTLRDLGHLEQARDAFDEAARINPDDPVPLTFLGNVAAAEGDADDARQFYDKALSLGPNDGLRIRAGTLIPAAFADEAAAAAWRARFRDELAGLLDAPLSVADPVNEVGTTHFYLAYQGQNDREDLETLARLHLKSCPSLGYVADHCRDAYAGPDGARIRIGFHSPFFYNHSVGRLMEGVVRLLPRERFDVTVLASQGKPDDLAREIADSADRYVRLPRDLGRAREAIAAERLDILVHAGIGLDPFIYFLGFARLAPMQCVSWGHPVTSGLVTQDHYISSVDAESADADAHYTERLARLGHVTTWFRPPPVPAPGTRPAGSGHVYFCPQSLFKLTPDFDGLAAAILEGDRDGRLVLLEGQRPRHTEIVRDRLARRLAKDMARVQFLPRLSGSEFLARLADADVLLDPPRFSGGNTTLEAFAAGTPVVTWPSEFRRGRLTYAFYRQMGIADCVAADAESYVRIALRCASDGAARGELVERIRAAAGTIFENDAVIAEHAAFFEDALARAAGHRPRTWNDPIRSTEN